MAGTCGSCTACCRVFAIPEIGKPINVWCTFCDIGVGCKIYKDRPQVCHEFMCLWLESQQQETPMHPDLRPDKSRVVISATTSEKIISFTTMPGNPQAWRKGRAHSLAVALVKNGFHVVIGPPGSLTRTVLTMIPHTGEIVEKQQRMTEPDEKGMQWNID